MNDFDFSKFNFDNSWFLTLNVNFIGKQCSIKIIVDGEPDIEEFETEQVQVLNFLKDNLNELLLQVEIKIFDYYQINQQEFSSHFPNSKRMESTPILSSLSELGNLLNFESIIVPFCFDPGSIEFGLAFDCSWDPSHGLGVLYKNFQFSKIGTFDIING